MIGLSSYRSPIPRYTIHNDTPNNNVCLISDFRSSERVDLFYYSLQQLHQLPSAKFVGELKIILNNFNRQKIQLEDLVMKSLMFCISNVSFGFPKPLQGHILGIPLADEFTIVCNISNIGFYRYFFYKYTNGFIIYIIITNIT